MALVPTSSSLLRDWWDDWPLTTFDRSTFDRPWSLLDRSHSFWAKHWRYWDRPWRSYFIEPLDGVTRVEDDKHKYKVTLDMRNFSPSEINVKTFGNTVTVEAKTEKRGLHNVTSREFTKTYEIPEGHDVYNISSNLSSSGYLTISAPKLPGTKVVPVRCWCGKLGCTLGRRYRY